MTPGPYVLVADAGGLPVADSCVDCVVTSPPYNVGLDYDGLSDLRPVADYLSKVLAWCAEIARVLVPGGRAWVNVAPAVPWSEEDRPSLAGLWEQGALQDRSGDRMPLALQWHQGLLAAGLRFRDWVVWDQVGQDAATAWGSYCSPNAPNLRGRYELVLVFSKGSWNRGRVGRNDIDPSRWPELTRNIWRMPSAPRNGHPAPFCAELPRRAILLSTWPGDVVLDPFCGSGTTLRAARDLGRIGVGTDLSAHYATLAQASVAQGVLL